MRDWTPFKVAPEGARGAKPRAISVEPGIGDRLRAAAFAELQAIFAFEMAIERFEDVPDWLSRGWKRLLEDERRHYRWLVNRMEALGVDPAEREVSDRLWRTISRCESAGEFCHWISEAEEWGRTAAV